jgi:hypothetical protein
MTFRNTLRSTSFLLTVIVMQLQWTQSTAFVVGPSHHQDKTTRMTSHHFVSTIYSDFSAPRNPFSRKDNNNNNQDDTDDALLLDALGVVIETTSSTVFTPSFLSTTSPDHHQEGRLQLNKMEMPTKHGPTANEMESAQLLMSMEMTLGRAAMLLAVVFMATELTTGMSLPQQLASVWLS